MANYDFLNLSPVDFEDLSRDLLQKHFNVYLESFANGRDRGIDLRYSNEEDSSFILQCKRFKNYANLRTNLKYEFLKVKDLNPKSYILATSIDLSPDNKDEIIRLFEGYIKTTSNIFGQKDLNNLLTQYSDIERKHFKLWLPSVNILNSIIHADIINKSEFEQEIVTNEINIFVPSICFAEAIDILSKFNFIIISGIPGIGKTTLAKMLIYQYLSEGYELIIISKDIDEALSVYTKDKKQIFFYDDFLGNIFLQKLLDKNEEKRLALFIQKIKNQKDKKIIFTSREYIINQAKQIYKELNDEELDMAKCIIELGKYNRKNKTQILYNHLFYSNIDKSIFNKLSKNQKYLEIIDHKNFSPLIIAKTIWKNRESTPENFVNKFISDLNNPIEIWENAFKNQITEKLRFILYVLLSCSGFTTKRYLITCVNELFNKNSLIKYIINSEIDFTDILKELDNSFIKMISFNDNQDVILFQNHSIEDYLINRIKNDDRLILFILNGINGWEQIFSIFTTVDIIGKVIIPDNLYSKFKDFILEYFDKLEYNSLITNKNNHTASYNTLDSKKSILLKLDDIYENFDCEEDIQIRNFIIKHLLEESKVYNLCEFKSYYFYLIEKLFKYLNSDILSNLIAPLFINLVDYEDIKYLLRMKILLNEEFNVLILTRGFLNYDSIEELEYGIGKIVTYFIETEVSENLDFYLESDDLSMLLTDIYNFEIYFNIDLSSQLDIIYNYDDDDDDDDDNEIFGSQDFELNTSDTDIYENNISDKEIMEIFDSLKDLTIFE